MSAPPPNEHEEVERRPSESSVPSPTPHNEEDLPRPEPTLLYLGDHSNQDNPYGFRIYRTTYGDDDNWKRFMEYLKAQAKKSFEEEDHGAVDPYERLDLAVVESTELDGASSEEVRAKFLEWIASGEEPPDNSSRFLACVAVDCDSLASVISMLDILEENDESIDSYDMEGLAYVDLISRNEREETVHMCISHLYPRAFNFVQGLGWESIKPEDGRYTAAP